MQWTVETGSSEGGAGGKTALVDEFEECSALLRSTEGKGALENASARADALAAIVGASLVFFLVSGKTATDGVAKVASRASLRDFVEATEEKVLLPCCIGALLIAASSDAAV